MGNGHNPDVIRPNDIKNGKRKLGEAILSDTFAFGKFRITLGVGLNRFDPRRHLHFFESLKRVNSRDPPCINFLYAFANLFGVGWIEVLRVFLFANRSKELFMQLQHVVQ